MITHNIPNHSQSARISNDIRRMQSWQKNQNTPWSDIHSSWSGNSYSAYNLTQSVEGANGAPTTAIVYHLIHWSTEIATIEFREDEITRVTFDARYISTTTRQYQRRIVDALSRSGFDTNLLEAELKLSTHHRGTVSYLTDIHGRTL